MDLTHRFRDCACPGTPHDNGDTVTFPARLAFDQSARALGLIFGEGKALAQNAFPVYLHAPLTWNLLDEEGDPVPLTEEALDALDFADQWDIAAYGDTLYAGTVLSPLVRLTKKPSEPGPTTGSSKRRSRS